MKTFASTNDLLDFAIAKEQEAADFYRSLAAETGGGMGAIFTDFSKEELRHKAKLESVKVGKMLLSAERKVQDLKIGDYLVEPETEPGKDMSYQDALVLAMRREKAAFRLYTDLADVTDSAEVRTLMLSLAQEEAKHKLRFELEYDQHVLTEN